MKEIIVIAGPTAVGKTEYAIEIAQEFNGEIVSCDSMQLYKYMDIGSAKPSKEQLERCKHHLVDQIDPICDFSVAKYQKMAYEAISDIISRGKTPIIEGGTGLYLNSLLFDMDFTNTNRNPELRKQLEKEAEMFGKEFVYLKLKALDEEIANRIHPNNLKKIIRAIETINNGYSINAFQDCTKKNTNYQFKMLFLTRDREELYERIDKRVDHLIEMGLVKEVDNLLSRGLTTNDISMKGIGYKEVIGYLNGEYDLNTAIDLVKKNTRHYAKRQITWFKRYDDMKWINITEYETDAMALEDIIKWLKTSK